jgi:hypothetical protein
MPQFVSQEAQAAILPAVRAFTRLHPGTAWPASDAAWTYIPLLQPRYCRDCVAPETPKAEFVYEYGTIKREWSLQFFTEAPGVLDGYYAQIAIQLEGYAPVPVWIGTIEHDLTRPESDIRVEGSQTFTAFGLVRLLEKQPIDRAYCEQDGKVIIIKRLPRFNDRSNFGNTLVGNRSRVKSQGGVKATYVISAKGDRTTWTALDVVELLTKRYQPKGWTIGLSGQWRALESIKDVWDPNRWPNVKTALDDVIDRKRGLGWLLLSNGWGTIWLHVFSYSDIPVSFGGIELPANAWPTHLELPSAYPYTHLIDPINFAFSQMAQFDTILIESEEFLRSMFTVSYRKRGLDENGVELDGDGNMVEGWPANTEAVYRQAHKGSAIANDTARSDDVFEHIYTRHLIGLDRADPTRFDWIANGGDASSYGTNVAYTAKDDGTVDVGPRSDVWMGEKTVERELPILKHRKYEQAPVDGKVVSDQPLNTDPEFVPLLAIMRDPFYTKPEDDPNAPANVYGLVDHLDSFLGGPSNMSVRPLDKGLGIHIGCSPGHRLALNHWAGATATSTPPEFDYKDLIITLSVRLDQRLNVRLEHVAFPLHHTNRTHRILVSGIEYWRANAGTVIGVNANRTLKRIHDRNLVLRNDVDRLNAFAAFVRQWYSQPRNTVEIPFKSLGIFAPLGALLKGITGVALSQPINTVITARQSNFALRPDDEASIETRLQTGCWSAEEAVGMFTAV